MSDKPTPEDLDAVHDKLTWHDDDVVMNVTNATGKTVPITRAEAGKTSLEQIRNAVKSWSGFGTTANVLRTFETEDGVRINPENASRLLA